MNRAAAEPKQNDQERNAFSLFSFTKKRMTLDFFALLCYTENAKQTLYQPMEGADFFMFL